MPFLSKHEQIHYSASSRCLPPIRVSGSPFDSQAGLSFRPHSRQHVSKRGVMSPQNGHIRCKAKSPSCGAMRKNCLVVVASQAGRLRRRISKGWRTRFMAATPTFLRFLRRTRRQAVGTAGIRHSCQILTRLMITVRFPQICAGLLSEREFHSWHLRQFIRPPRSRCKESNLEQIHLQMGGNNAGASVSLRNYLILC